MREFGAEGNGTHDDLQSILDAIAASNGNAIFFPPGIYRTSGPITLTSPVELVGAAGLLTREGPLPLPPARLLVDPNVDGIVVGSGGGGSSIVRLGITQGGSAGTGTGRGIRFLETVNVWACSIANFGGHGIYAPVPVQNEQCYSHFFGCSIFNCDDNVHLEGGPHTFHGITTLNSRGRGIFVDSAFGSEFHGVLFRSCNALGQALVAHPTVQTDGSHFFGCVIGGGNGNIELHKPSIMFGGRQTVGFTSNSDGLWLGGDANGWSPSILIVNKRGTSTITRALGVNNSNQIVDQFQAGTNDALQMKWQEASLQNAWLWYSEGVAPAALGITDTNHRNGRGMLLNPRGRYVGNGNSEILEVVGAYHDAPPADGSSPRTSTQWLQGDKAIVDRPTAGGVDHWRCVQDGPGAVWKAITLPI